MAAPSWDDLHALANGQSGHFTAQQAAEAGFSFQLLHKHVRSGNLERPARGIYRIARFPPSEHEDLVVLWLWSAQQAVFSHETALQLHELSDVLPARIHLTLPEATPRRRTNPEGTVVHFADVPAFDRQWLGPVPITKPARSVLDVAAAHGDASLVGQAIDQGIAAGLFHFADVAAAGRYVADAQSRSTAFDDRSAGLGAAAGVGTSAGSGLGDRFFARPIQGTCTRPPPADWPMLAAEPAQEIGGRLRLAQYLPSRTMVLEYAWPADRVPTEREIRALRRRLAKRFSWA
ncbi:MAG: type IV toxin-antitoxin system AbiEi family antitoxin domain-containing protein [Myxococcales bacterium]|nr:type IV toxin-antitoxin system AbiEi family antitoxin domain-containing protein [Myxococcales bacterium]